MIAFQILVLVGASAFASAPCPGEDATIDGVIVTRHDRADSLYLELGKRFDAVGKVGRGGDGTLVAPEWMLTAAHVARGMMRRSTTPTVRLGGKTYAVSQVILHPDWRDMGPHDIALVRLSDPVQDEEPIPSSFYDASELR